ncbi:hypothetical protein [Helicobacter canis]|nr:hypothetical protein [Helicobacter canis]
MDYHALQGKARNDKKSNGLLRSLCSLAMTRGRIFHTRHDYLLLGF